MSKQKTAMHQTGTGPQSKKSSWLNQLILTEETLIRIGIKKAEEEVSQTSSNRRLNEPHTIEESIILKSRSN